MTSRIARMAAGVLALSLLAGACGDDDEGADDAATQENDDNASDDTATESDDMSGEGEDLVDTAVAAGDFTTLVAAVQAAGLEEALRGEGPSPCSPRPTRRSRRCPPAPWTRCSPTPRAADGDPDVPRRRTGSAKDVAGMDGQAVTTLNGATFTVGVEGDEVTSRTPPARPWR